MSNQRNRVKHRYSLRNKHFANLSMRLSNMNATHEIESQHNSTQNVGDAASKEEGAASLLAQGNQRRSTGTEPRPSTSQSCPPVLGVADVSGEDEQLAEYIHEVVTAAVGVNRAADYRFIRDEMERSRICIRNEVASIVRETLATTTPVNRPLPAENIAPPQPVPRRSPPTPPLRARNPAIDQPQDVSRNENADEFLRQLNNLSLNDPSSTIAGPTRLSTGHRIQNFHKWGIKFDSRNMSVDDFLFRLERLKVCYNASWDEILLNFHHFVSGPVENWYWVYLKSNPAVTWMTLRLALVEQYRSLETDSELSRKLSDSLNRSTIFIRRFNS